MGSDFEAAGKAIVNKVAAEIINPISATNLDLAATISEYLVEKALTKLERINSKMVCVCVCVQQCAGLQYSAFLSLFFPDQVTEGLPEEGDWSYSRPEGVSGIYVSCGGSGAAKGHSETTYVHRL